MLINDKQITISAAGSRKATFWPQQKLYWSELVEKLKTPARGTETLAEYLRYPKTRQDELKDIGGFVAGTLKDNRRKASNVLTRDIITLDLDNIPTGGTQEVLRRIDGLGCSYAVYSTRKHEEAKPRLRVLVPLNRPATADEYEPIARKLAQIIGIELCDPTTFEASRLMYWPSCCLNSNYVYAYGDKPFLDADGILSLYKDWRNVLEWPEVTGAQLNSVKQAAKQGNPIEKTGVIGAFCRTYDIYKAMEVFLSGVYIPCEDGSGRFTYSGGSTTGGAVVYENGNFLYSHHSTDPAGGRLVNSFDLVRLHKFSEMDNEAKIDTPVNKLPSYTAMCELAVSDVEVSALLNKERYEKAVQDFALSPEAAGKNDFSWIAKLKIIPSTGAIAKTTNNLLIIFENDPLLKDKIAFDEFASRAVVMGAVPWDANPEQRQWGDLDDKGIRWYVENTYDIVSPNKVDDALGICANNHSFSRVKDYLTKLQWDGIKRLDTLLIDYLGAVDTTYTRAVMRKSLAAAVARAMTPGCKYDYMPILAGPQGIGKSTFLRILGQSWYSDSLQTFEGKEASEMLQGIWINEIGELSGFNRSETNAIKQFLSKNEDIYREPFGKRTKAYPRRCVFFGTTNDSEFLKDRTGNRRFWPVDVGLKPAAKNVWNNLPLEADQIWAEAYLYWQLGEKLFLTDEAELQARLEQEAHSESNAKEGIIREFVNRPIPINWDKRTLNERRLYWAVEYENDNSETMERDRICSVEIWCECLGGDLKYMRRADSVEINSILEKLPGWKRLNTLYRFGSAYGHQRGFIKD
ncbi:virulence-associated protein E [Clostridium sp. YIM B02515]|uniref:Virulence-associated protein E n=1 Tax=Clostridium rhizosphaerae TaxID=2803861 RepID=A0ABS1TI41_9CLOT|nr:virulence-associated E family protein [Clostridium rhizosphaerae]MBL4937613.1 virulence-associated protein E [Clostridium rhizosphaerae]